MGHQNKSQKSEHTQQVRGADLREKIIQSQTEGEEYRSQNQGTDQFDSGTRHHKVTTNHREIKEQTKK
jgi:hypothetical protein